MTTEIRLTQATSPFLTQSESEKEGVRIIHGFAVHVGTFNDVTISREELEKSVQSLIGKPILKNHKNEIEVTVGKVVDAWTQLDTDNGEYGIAYEAEIDAEEEDLIRKMKLEFVSSVSVGFLSDHICSICGKSIYECEHWFWDEGFQILAKDIRFLELSVVAVPADKDATVKINFKNDDDKVAFAMLEQLKQERRTNMSDNFETKYNEVVDNFTAFKLEKAAEINAMKEEFKAEKEQLEADKLEQVEKVISLQSQVDSLAQEKEELEKEVSEFKESFAAIEEERLSVLREKVSKLNAEVNGGYTDEEINSLEETTLNRIAQSFEHISEHMVKVQKPNAQVKDQYKADEGEEVSLAQKLAGSVQSMRGF